MLIDRDTIASRAEVRAAHCDQVYKMIETVPHAFNEQVLDALLYKWTSREGEDHH